MANGTTHCFFTVLMAKRYAFNVSTDSQRQSKQRRITRESSHILQKHGKKSLDGEFRGGDAVPFFIEGRRAKVVRFAYGRSKSERSRTAGTSSPFLSHSALWTAHEMRARFEVQNLAPS